MKFAGLTTALVAIIGFAAVADAAPSPSDLNLEKRASNSGVVVFGIVSKNMYAINASVTANTTTANDTQKAFQDSIDFFKDQCGQLMDLCSVPEGAFKLVIQLLRNILTVIAYLIPRLFAMGQDGIQAIITAYQLVQLLIRALTMVIPTLLFSILTEVANINLIISVLQITDN